MTAQEAIKNLEVFTTDEAQRLTSSEFDDSITMAIEALEKQSKLERVIERLEADMKERIDTSYFTLDVFVDGQANGIEWAIEKIKEELM